MSRIGPYEIVKEIGRGGMGIVFRALDPVIGRAVAVKTIRLDDLSDPKEKAWLRERLFREAQSAGVLSHPNIVTIYQIAEQDELAYIAMEFVGGPNLDQVLSGSKAMEPAALLEMVRQIAAALDYAHSKGIVHRDIKPANIIFSESGDVKITDFGIAKLSLAQRSTRTGMVIGTPLYMSPEQIQGKPVDGRADQFSLAVMVFAMLTGVKPFDADTLTALFFKIVYEDPPPVVGFNPTLSMQIEAALHKALAKGPAARFATCTEFWKALAAACAVTEGWRPMLPAAPRSRVAASEMLDRPTVTPLLALAHPAVQHCPECQAVLPLAGVVYCGYCGVSLTEAAARAEERRAEEERRRVEAEQKLAEETRRAAEERRRTAEEQRRAAEERQRGEEERTRIEAERRKTEALRLAAEERQRQDEEVKRLLAQQQHRAAEEKQRRAEEEKRIAAARQKAEEEERRTREAVAAEAGRRRLASLRAEGAMAFDHGEYARAVEWWEEALKLVPEDAELQGLIAGSRLEWLRADAEASEKEAPQSEQPGPGEPTEAHTEPAKEREPRAPQFAMMGQSGGPQKPPRPGLIALGVALLMGTLWFGFWVFNHRGAESSPPVIEQFTATPASIHAGGTARLSWSVRGATRVAINPGIGEMTASGDFSIFPTQTTTYELKAFGGGRAISAKTTLWVNSPTPESRVAASLTAMPSGIVRAGRPVVLSWSVTGTTVVSIDHGIGWVPSSGRRSVQPKERTTYTLTAQGPAGDLVRTVTVEVGTVAKTPAGRQPQSPGVAPMAEAGGAAKTLGDPPAISFWAESTTVAPGAATAIHWDVRNATHVSIDHGVGSQPPYGGYKISPPATTTLTLTADGLGGTRTAAVTVNVKSPPAPPAEPPVISFWAESTTVAPGETAAIHWDVRNATQVSIDHGVGPQSPYSSYKISLPATTTLTLTADGPGGTRTAKVTVNVESPPTPTGELTPVIGRVVWNGIPVANVGVELRQAGQSAVLNNTVSAADGTFAIQAPQTGKTGRLWIWLWPRSSDYWRDIGHPVTIMAGKPNNVGDLTIAKKLRLFLPADGAVVTTATPTFQWVAYPSSTRYFVRVLSSVTHQVVFSQSTQGTQITVSAALRNGPKYSWDVYAYNSSGQMIAYDGRGFTIQ